jgi:hypothetical protein
MYIQLLVQCLNQLLHRVLQPSEKSLNFLFQGFSYVLL